MKDAERNDPSASLRMELEHTQSTMQMELNNLQKLVSTPPLPPPPPSPPPPPPPPPLYHLFSLHVLTAGELQGPVEEGS